MLGDVGVRPPIVPHLLSQHCKVLARLLSQEAQPEDGAVQCGGGIEGAALQVVALGSLNVGPGESKAGSCAAGDGAGLVSGQLQRALQGAGMCCATQHLCCCCCHNGHCLDPNPQPRHQQCSLGEAEAGEADVVLDENGELRCHLCQGLAGSRGVSTEHCSSHPAPHSGDTATGHPQVRAVHNQGHPAAHTCCCLHAAGTRPAPHSSSHCPQACSAPSSHLHCRGQALSIGSCLWRGDGLRPLDSPWWDASMAPETQSCSEWHAALGPCGGGGGWDWNGVEDGMGMEKEMDGDGMGMGIEMGMEMVGWAPTPHSPPPIGSSCVHW